MLSLKNMLQLAVHGQYMLLLPRSQNITTNGMRHILEQSKKIYCTSMSLIPS